MMAHRTFGKLALFLVLKYGWSADDIFKEFQRHKQVLRDYTARNLEPVITRIGIGAQVGIGPEGVGAGPSVALAFSIAKTVTLYRSESRTPQAMALGGDAAMDRQLIEEAKKKFPDSKIEIHGRVIKEAPVELVRHDDGQLAVGVRGQSIDLTKEAPAQRDLSHINESLKATGIQLKPSEDKEMAGLLEVVIPELDRKTDPTYNKRSTRLYIDPSMEGVAGSNAGKGLIVRNGKIYLATTANPDLIFRRLDYSTPFRDRDGATAHSIIAITDTPQRTIDEIKKASGWFVQKRPGQALMIRSAGNEVDQRNIQYYDGYQKNPGAFEKYSEKAENWKPYLDAAQNRKMLFVDLSTENVRPGLINEGGFSDKFYKRFHNTYKDLTTVRNGKPLDFKKLHAKIQEEFKKDPAYTGKALNVAELNEICIDLTRRSWAALGNNPAERERLFRQRLEWAQQQLGPIWQKHIDQINKRKPGTITKTGSQLITEVVKNLKDTKVNGPRDPLSPGSLTTTLAGTEGIQGYRPNSGVTELFGLDRYEEYLGDKSINGEIARVILETQSPLPEDDKEFMQSPLALRTFGKLGLILYFGPGQSESITACFRDGVVAPMNRAAFDKFKKLVTDIREAQLNKAGGNIIRLDNGYLLRLRPVQIASGVDPTCANFSISVNEDFDLVVMNPEGGIVMGSKAKEHMTVNASEVPAWFQLGIGAFGMIRPGKEPPPPPPPGEQPKAPDPGRGNRGVVEGGKREGGTEDVRQPDTDIGKGKGEGGSPTNPDEVP